jgi:hypothetical protein
LYQGTTSKPALSLSKSAETAVRNFRALQAAEELIQGCQKRQGTASPAAEQLLV